MAASGSRGIPTSFIVDQTGTVAWIGHPMSLDLVLGEVVAGKWDPKTGPERLEKANKAFDSAMKTMTTDAKGGLAAWEAAEKEFPSIAKTKQTMKFNALLGAKLWAEASTTGGKLADHAISSKNVMELNEIAWTIVDPDMTHEKRDLDLAFKAASKAVEFSASKDAAVMDTLAWVYFLKGDTAKAIEIETQAITIAKGAIKDELEGSLKKFQEGKK
jgi:tetratricopeptide (TPR) repeat protein